MEDSREIDTYGMETEDIVKYGISDRTITKDDINKVCDDILDTVDRWLEIQKEKRIKEIEKCVELLRDL